MFWIKLNQRFQLLRPENETFAAQIETAIYNAALRAMVRVMVMVRGSVCVVACAFCVGGEG